MENTAHLEPSKLPYQLLKHITNDFDEERILGSGGFGTVYKGVYENREEIAVKVLHNISGLDDKQFDKEFNNLRGLKHPNIVELVGFCNEYEEELAVFEGKQVTAERLRMALCFEYVHNGSLNKLISDETTGLNWQTRYRIIKGICEGLKYLREGLDYPIMHFDLKPDNILLDKCMVPKIADFGLSKLFGEENTQKATSSAGTRGYCPPEYVKHQIISREFDIFSLGVIIIRIMAGHERYNSIVEMSTRRSVKLVHESWRKRLSGTLSQTSLEVYCNQVKRCIEIALNCLIPNRQERPTIQDIVNSLNETETKIGDRRMLNSEQFYQDDRESTLSSDLGSITIDFRPSLENFMAVEPKVMPLSLLKEMTDDFSEERLVGNDGHGRVYKGVHGDGQVIVVKSFDDKKLQNEIAILTKLHHQNIVQFIGYCHEPEEIIVQCKGKPVIAENIHKVLCFEYMNGSLEQYLSLGMESGLSWQTRYEIIKGVSEGLRYLHEGLERPILHMNLNPENILMDEKMMPKIGGFGDARFVDVGNTHRTMSFIGKRGYMPPEFIEKQVISKEFDIYNLGAIILNLMTEKELYWETGDTIPGEYIKLVLEKWRQILQKTVTGRSVEGYYQQVQKCLEIAVKCMERDRYKRPTIRDIVHKLNETETSMIIPQLDSELLVVHPLELCFLTAVSSSLEVPSNKVAMISPSCSLQLDNKGNDRVAFMLVANSPNRYLTKGSLCGVVPPRCTHTLTLTMRNNKQPPSLSDSGGDFFTLYSASVGEYELLNVDKDSVSDEYVEFLKRAKDKTGHEVQEVTLRVLCCQQQSDRGTSSELYQDDGESTLPYEISSITMKSIPSGPGEAKLAAVEPRVMPLSSLKEMTDNFSEARLVGQGLHASVYKGVYGDGQVIAVKRLRHLHGIDDKQFQSEIAILMMIQHRNIMQLVGYCNETEERVVQYNGKHVVADEQHRMMCFEYLQSGSLEHYISADINSGLDWKTRYGILKGICEGLKYLHEGLESPIIHMDLKPSNIMMDEKMMPKIGHFGFARLVGVENTHRTMSMMGTIGYMPPEFIEKQVISKEFDIYSLGVITLRLMMGQQSYHEFREMPPQKFIELAHERWRRRLHKTVHVTLVDGYCQQVKKCLEIAVKCVEIDRHKRPPIGDIVHALNEIDLFIPQLESGPVLELDSNDSEVLLEVHPLELCFLTAMSSSSSSLGVARKKKVIMSSSCSLQLNNKGNDRVAFMLVANSPKRYLTKEPLCGVVPPRCAYTLTLTMCNNKQPPSSLSSTDNSDADFFTLYSAAVGEYDLLNVEKDSVLTEYDKILKKAKEKAGHEVQEVNVLCCQQQADLGTSSSEPARPTVEIITTTNAQQVSSIDMHPTEPWILTVHHVGSLRVWNYRTMATLNSIQDVTEQPVHAAKFIAREKWLVAGDRSGCIHVYSYENEDVVSFNAHDSFVTTLAVHPVETFVLSSSNDDDHLIKLWDWHKGWECTTFQGHDGRVTQVMFNPTDSDSFVSASLDGTVKIWSICSDDPSNIITLKLDEHALCVDYFTRYNRQHLIVGCKDKTAQIWALGIKGHVGTLEGHEDRITAVKLHPELPLVMTGSLDGTVRIWDSTTYKPENIIGFNLGGVYAFGCIKDSRRIVVGCHQGIATMEITLP